MVLIFLIKILSFDLNLYDIHYKKRSEVTLLSSFVTIPLNTLENLQQVTT